MEKYSGVRGAENVRAITAALEESGASILAAPKPDQAPFEFEIETPEGERVSLVCYAFTANKYEQGGRPTDEHRLQVKYGHEFDRYHDLYMDESRRRVTLMFGWHAQAKIFVAIDPTMHNPTWFSRSIEFKDEHVRQARRSGWFGWERDRKMSRRKIEMPHENCTTEALLGFAPKNFLRYVMLERIASGLDAGERLLMIDRMGRAVSPKATSGLHPLEVALGLPAKEILDVLGGSFRLLVAVRGSVAERHLLDHLEGMNDLSKVERFDKDGLPDFAITYRKRKFRIECKNVLRRLQKDQIPRVDFQKTRAAKGNPCSRYYSPTQFEVLAACLHPVTEKWEYKFAPTSGLPPHKKCRGRMAEKILVAGEIWTSDLQDVLDGLC